MPESVVEKIVCPLKEQIISLLEDLHTTLGITKRRLALQILGISKATYSRWMNEDENYPKYSMRKRTIRLLHAIHAYIEHTSAEQFLSLADRVNPHWKSDDDDRSDMLHAKLLATAIPLISIHENEYEQALPIAGLLEKMTISQIITAVVEEKDVDEAQAAQAFEVLFEKTLAEERYQADKWQECKKEFSERVRTHYATIDTIEDEKRNREILKLGQQIDALLKTHIETKEEKINEYNQAQLTVAKLELGQYGK